MRASANLWGTVCVVFQLENTVGKNEIFRKPFTMFGIAVVGQESSVFGYNRPLCYLALDWLPTVFSQCCLIPTPGTIMRSLSAG
jgi:hypothetical protein